MARRRNRGTGNVRKPTPAEIGITAQDVAAELAKMLRLPNGATSTPIQTPAPLTQGSYSGGSSWATGWSGSGATSLAPGGWTDPLVPFGPGVPIFPAGLDPIQPENNRPFPRRSEFPISWNLPGNGTRYVPWTVLRGLAAGVGIIRKCVEIRKGQMTQLDWDIVPASSVFEQMMLQENGSGTSASSTRAKLAAAGDPEAKKDQEKSHALSKYKIEHEFRQKNAGDIARLKEWWTKPDRINDWTWEDWLGAVMEEYLVLDAVSLYPHQDLKGDLHSLELIDGSTIKPLLDHRGATPQPPNPAYQQMLYGFPRGEFTFTSGDDGEYSRDTLLYKPRHRRSFSPYGLSPTEQCIFDADLYMKRRLWMESEYDDGVSPELLVKVDSPMTAQQLRDYETVFNDILSGNTRERHRARFLPSGFEPVLLPSLEERYRSDYDLYLIRLIALAFDVMPTELGFPPQGGLGGKGMSDGEENSTYRKTIRPDSKWLTGMINEVSTSWLNMPTGLTFQFLGLEAEDEKAAMDVMEALAGKAAITVNEMRDRQGLPRYDLPEADMPMIITQRDVIPLEGALDRASQTAAGKAGGQPPQVGPDGKPVPAPAPGQPGTQGQNQAGAAGASGAQTGPAPTKEAPAQGAPTSGAEAASGSTSTGKSAGPDGAVAGLAVLAQDTGRLLMLQRALVDGDPAAGSWEFPGGHVEDGETDLDGAQREWAEEVGQPVPAGSLASTWSTGKYTGHVWTVPSEDSVTINADPDDRHVLNPDDPDGDAVEVVAWWDPAHLTGNPAVRRELAASMDVVRGALATAADTVSASKAAEAEKFRTFVRHLRKGNRQFRPFTFEHHPGYIATAANDLAEAGEYAAANAVLDVVIA
jgi:8-oxo-dGTP pyrophosphatase MutT (NUDIX family)